MCFETRILTRCAGPWPRNIMLEIVLQECLIIRAPPHTHTYCLRWVDSRFINSPIFNHRVSFMYFTDLFVSCFSPQESLGHPLPPFSLNNPVKLVRLLVCGRLTQRAFMTEPRLEPGSLRGLDCHYVHCNGSRVAPLCGWCASAQEGKIFAE